MTFQKTKNSFQIRQLHKEEYPQLKQFLYQAIFVEDPQNPPEESITETPELQRYIEAFGRAGDLCFVAELSGKQLAGAVWTRYFPEEKPGYGFAGPDIPELSISLLPEFRGQGMGTALMKAILEELKKQKVKQVSLSVSKKNRAFELYSQLGFRIIEEHDNDCLMLYSFSR